LNRIVLSNAKCAFRMNRVGGFDIGIILASSYAGINRIR
jgi:hypothetical protein